MILLVSSMDKVVKTCCHELSLHPDTVKHYRQVTNALLPKHQIMPKACHLKLQNPDDRNDPNGEKNIKLYNYTSKIGKVLDLTTLRVMTTCLSYSEFLTPVVKMWKILYSSKELKIVSH